MIEIMDRGIGALIAELDALDLRKNTLVIFASDNGPDPIPGSRFNHGLRGMKYGINEGGVRVPLVFNWPAKSAGGERQALVHFTDIFPTLVEFAALKMPPNAKPLDGVSLVPALAGRSDRTEVARFWHGGGARADAAVTVFAVEAFPAALVVVRHRDIEANAEEIA